MLLCLLLIALPAVADVYTYVDAQGNRVFTDQPHTDNAHCGETQAHVPLPTAADTGSRAGRDGA
jgi:hypothetical protein